MNDMYDLIDDEPITREQLEALSYYKFDHTWRYDGRLTGVTEGTPRGQCLIYKLLIDKGWWPHE